VATSAGQALNFWIRKPYRPVSPKAIFLVYMTSATAWISWFSFFFYFHLIHSFFRTFCTRLLMNCFYSPFLQSNGERQWNLRAYLSSALIRTCRKAFLMPPVDATGLKILGLEHSRVCSEREDQSSDIRSRVGHRSIIENSQCGTFS